MVNNENINVFYKKKCHSWEEDFLENDVFNQKYFDFPINIKYLNEDMDINIYKSDKNIIIFNDVLKIDYLNFLIENLNPKMLIFIGDESGNKQVYHELEKKTNIFYRQYNNPRKIMYNKNSLQFPLGYVKHFLKGESSLDIECLKIKDRKYISSFVGTMKSDRYLMCKIFKDSFPNSYFASTQTDWGNPLNQIVKPDMLYDIYNQSIFVVNGRGNISLDCFRIYEGIVAGAIPVIVGNMNEIEETFNYNNDMPIFIIGKDWNNALLQCKELLKDIDKLQEFQNKNKEWWKRNICLIQNNIKLLI